MSDISNQLIKDSYNYVLQSDLSTGIVYRIGGGIPVNPKFLSGLTINNSFNYSDGTEQPGFVLITDAFGNATWGPISGSSSGNYLSLSGGTVTGPTIFTSGLTANTFSASTYLGLPIDIRVTGATKSGSVATFTNNTGGTFTLTGLTDVFVTGGTYSSSTGVTIFRNNTGGTFTVTGYFTPSNDIYVSGGTVDHGPSTNGNNDLELDRSDLSKVTISNLVNISPATKSEIDSLISNKWIIRGKTYKISGCDTSLYYNGTGKGDVPVYTSIYLMGLENNKLSETGIGVFYTPKYSDFSIFVDGNTYGQGDKVIWGGYVWECTGGVQVSIDLFTLDPRGFGIIYPFDGSDAYNTSLYNIQYDDIIYDYKNDRIIYRNEENSNIVSTTYENISYWISDIGYNPIRVFQWGNVYNGSNGIGNQTIVNSYNENINYTGSYQINLNFKNRSYQKNINSSVDEGNYQDGIILENYSYIDSIDLERGPSYQSNIELSNNSYISNILLDRSSYQNEIILDNNSYISQITMSNADEAYQSRIFLSNSSYITNGIFSSSSYQRDFVFNNRSYMDTFVLGNDSYQQNFNFNNSSYQNNSTLDGVQEIIYMDRGSQSNGFSESQTNITVKGYDIDWSTYPSISPQTDLFFIHNLISDDTAPVYIGKINNRLVEVTKPLDIFVTGGTYTSGNIIFTNNTGGTFNVSGLTVGGGGGQIFYLNLSQSQGSNRLLSTTGSTASEQSTGVTINNGVTGTIASFQSQPLNTTLLPGGIWSFYLHSYKENTNASFNIFVELYKITSGGTQTLLFTTDPTPVTTNSPNPSMQLTDGYFSGTPLSVSDGVVAVVRATNTGNQSHTITLFTEGSQHYSYVVSTIPTQQGLTCDTLSGCSIIQTIQTDVSNKFDKSGGTITGNLIINSGLTANTISATTYQNLPTDVRVTGATYSNNTFTYTNNTGGTFSVLFNTVTGLTVNGNLTVTGTTTSTTISATTYQNLPATPFLPLSGGTLTGPLVIQANFNPFLVTTTNYSPGSAGNIIYYEVFTGSTNGFALNSRSNGGGASGSLILQAFGNGNVGVNKSTSSALNYNLDVNGSFGATSVSATTYQNLPTDIRVTGGTYSGSTIIFTNNTGGTFSVTGITTSSSFTGGTVTGATSFTGGLTANTISATTITSPSISPYGLIVATSLGYQNIF